jgi:hypothetical protein
MFRSGALGDKRACYRALRSFDGELLLITGDPLLEELLLKTYQDELAVLSNISQLTNSLANAPVNAPASMPASPTGERMQL